MDDTIYALATAQGKAGVAIVRISGPEAHSAAEQLCGPLPVAGRGVRQVRQGDGSLIDEALVLTFARGGSFTGEDVVELHLHGSPAIVAAVLAELKQEVGLRLAQAGEFTRRALENGCLDLAQVEGLADLIDAETEAQRKQAVRVFSGALGAKVETWRSKLIRALALIEATLDFADEEVPVDVGPEVLGLVADVAASMQHEIQGSVAAERIRCGFEVAIVGAPNVGKSTLLNRLAGRDAAITSDLAGTTRDVIEVQMDIAGLPVTLLDTAGLREAEDAVEQIGIARGRERAEQADLRLILVDGEDVPEVGPDDIVVWTKADLWPRAQGLSISATTGEGVDRLIDEVGARLGKMSASAGLAIRARHRAALETGVARLEQIMSGIDGIAGQDDLLAEDLRLAVRAVDSLVGRVDVEDVLGEIFASFCIGK